MATLLQACSSEPETYHVLRQCCQQLFLQMRGMYLLQEEQCHEKPIALQPVSCWMSFSPPQARISREYQQAFHGEMYEISPFQHSFYLYLNASENGYPYPMRDPSGQLLGILFLYFQLFSRSRQNLRRRLSLSYSTSNNCLWLRLLNNMPFLW